MTDDEILGLCALPGGFGEFERQAHKIPASTILRLFLNGAIDVSRGRYYTV